MTGQPWIGARDIEGPANFQELALVVERVHAVGIEIDSRPDVADERVVGETVPEAGHHIVELARAAVPLVVVEMILEAEIESSVRIGRGHDVPAGAASADMVERSEAAGDVIGLVEGGGGGRDQSDAFGHAGKSGQQGQGLERGDRRASSQGLDRHVEHGEMVGHEERVELSALERPREALEMLKVEIRVRVGARIAPPARMDSHRAHEGAEAQLPVGHWGPRLDWKSPAKPGR